MSDVLNDIPQELYEAAKRAAKSSLAEFARLLWGVVNPGVEMKWNWHLDCICDHLEAISNGQIKRLLINLPPGSCKSTLVNQMWPTWEWLKQPTKRWAFLTNVKDNAFKEAGYRRNILLSQEYAALSPIVSLQKGGKAVGRVVNTRNGEFKAFSIISKITGTHFDRFVLDDPNDAGSLDKEELDQVIKIYDTVISTRLRDNAGQVLIQQRLAVNDLAGHWLSKGCDAVIKLPAVYKKSDAMRKTPLGWEDLRKEEGELLWPERFTEEYLLDRKMTLGYSAFMAQYQQNPKAAAGEVFRKEWFRRDAESIRQEDFEEVLMCVDTASSLKESADRTVIQIWGRLGRQAHLIEQLSGRMTFPEKIKNILILAKKYNACYRCIIEGRNSGIDLINTLQPEMELIGKSVIQWASQAHKEARIRSITPFVENGQVFIPLGAEYELLLKEASGFPMATHDDCIDVMSMVLDFWRQSLIYHNAKETGQIIKKEGGKRLGYKTNAKEANSGKKVVPISKFLRGLK